MLSQTTTNFVRLFERIHFFLQRLNKYTKMSLAKEWTELLGKIMAQILFILPLSTKAMTERRLSELTRVQYSLTDYVSEKFFKKLIGKTCRVTSSPFLAIGGLAMIGLGYCLVTVVLKRWKGISVYVMRFELACDYVNVLNSHQPTRSILRLNCKMARWLRLQRLSLQPVFIHHFQSFSRRLGAPSQFSMCDLSMSIVHNSINRQSW